MPAVLFKIQNNSRSYIHINIPLQRHNTVIQNSENKEKIQKHITVSNINITNNIPQIECSKALKQNLHCEFYKEV
jgi:predicted transcriptional regulator